EQQPLVHAALPVVDADHAVDGECFDEDHVHGRAAPCGSGWKCGRRSARPAYSAGSDAMSQRGCTRMLASSCWPACRRSAPAKAIIAPLSVQNSSRGNATRTPAPLLHCCSRARKSRLAPTPPDTTRVRAPECCSARWHLSSKVSTTASSKARAMSARACAVCVLARQASSTWVLSPEKLKSRHGRSVIERAIR